MSSQWAFETKIYEVTQAGGGWTWYWELWIGGECVNGGLARSEWDARSLARSYFYQHDSRKRRGLW